MSAAGKDASIVGSRPVPAPLVPGSSPAAFTHLYRLTLTVTPDKRARASAIRGLSRRPAPGPSIDPGSRSPPDKVKGRSLGRDDDLRGMALAWPERGLQSKIGRASCRERVCQYVENSVVPGSLKKKINKN